MLLSVDEYTEEFTRSVLSIKHLANCYIGVIRPRITVELRFTLVLKFNTPNPLFNVKKTGEHSLPHTIWNISFIFSNVERKTKFDYPMI